MEIKKFEAYQYGYRGSGIKSDRKEFIREMIDCFVDSNLLGFSVTGTEYHPNDEILYLDLFNENTKEESCIKLDLSDLGIEIGKRKFDENTEEMGDFQVISNLDTDSIKHIKDYKKTKNKYNV